MPEPLLLEGPQLRLVPCPWCNGTGHVALVLMIARECPTCRGSGEVFEQRTFASPLDLRAWSLGLGPVDAKRP